MGKAQQLSLAGMTVLSLFAVNVLIVMYILYTFPSILIHDRTLQVHHQAIMIYIVNGNADQARQLLPQDQFSHITDVKNIIDKLPLIAIIGIIAMVVAYKRMNTESILKSLYQSIFFIVIFAASIGFLFEPFFILFHEILFPAGNWSFPADSILIRLYPENVWIALAGVIITCALIEILLIQKYIPRQRKPRS